MKHPPFCPNPHCQYHYDELRPPHWFLHHGHYFPKYSLPVRRFKCRHCGTRFSTRTFSLDFHTKKKLPYDYIFKQLKSAAGIRDIARDLKVSANTITNRIGRLARQSQAIQTALRARIKLNEDLVADGFESFAVSQYLPSNIHLLAGKHSQYLYAMDYAHLARKGRMTSAQKRKNIRLKALFPSGVTISRSFTRLCRNMDDILASRTNGYTVLYTDEKPQYGPILREGQFCRSLSHVQISSEEPRTVRNDLFSVNYLDREIRKDCANHVRETVQFSRNVNNVMERLSVYRLYHNYMKPYRIRGNPAAGIPVTHGEEAGIPAGQIRKELRTLFTMRRFYHRIFRPGEEDMSLWFRTLGTPLKKNGEKVPRYLAA